MKALRRRQYARQGWKERVKGIVCKKWELCHIDMVLLKDADAGSLP